MIGWRERHSIACFGEHWLPEGLKPGGVDRLEKYEEPEEYLSLVLDRTSTLAILHCMRGTAAHGNIPAFGTHSASDIVGSLDTSLLYWFGSMTFS